MSLNGTVCTTGCSDGTQILATIGAVALYAFVAWIMHCIFKEAFKPRTDDEKALIVIGAAVFPITLVILIGLWLVNLIILPFEAVRKEDLKEVETRLTEKIESVSKPVATPRRNPNHHGLKVGDFVTVKLGNPDGYKHLNEGSKSRVKSIDDKGRMKLVLVDHIDFHNQKDHIGREFKAPARNFTIVRTPTKPSKTKKSRR